MSESCPHLARAQHPQLDRSSALMRRGYPYLLGMRRAVDPEAAAMNVRLLGRMTTVLSGSQGARLFYDTAVMRRRGAIPRPVLRTLFGDGAVHSLDGADHAHRKALFLSLLTPGAALEIARTAGQAWRNPPDAEPLTATSVFARAVDVHAQAVCAWAGIPDDRVDATVGRDLAAIVDGFGSVGPRHVLARLARRRRNRWARNLIEDVRSGALPSEDGTTLEAVANYRGRDGDRLSAAVAAVELLNILRPTVAVAYFAAFAAHAVQSDPHLYDVLAGGGDDLYESFAHEVRRYYPFVPMLGAKVDRSTTFGGARLPRNRRVLLDVYGMLHDPQLWPDAGEFRVDRFVGVEPDPWIFVPQGGGDPATGHRCPGERVAVELIKEAARYFVTARPLTDATPDGFPLSRIPTRPLTGRGGGMPTAIRRLSVARSPS